MTRPKSKPSRDPNVQEADVVVPTSGTAPPAPAAEAPPPAALMPTVENEEKYAFTPAMGCSIPDVVEIALAYVLMLTGSPSNFEKGMLRRLGLPGRIHAKLSDDAAQWFTKVDPAAAPPASPPTPPTGA